MKRASSSVVRERRASSPRGLAIAEMPAAYLDGEIPIIGHSMS
jgi:hypothetical protein